MSTTEAAQLARLKVTYPQWQFNRITGGFAAASRSNGQQLTADSAAALECQLYEETARWGGMQS